MRSYIVIKRKVFIAFILTKLVPTGFYFEYNFLYCRLFFEIKSRQIQHSMYIRQAFLTTCKKFALFIKLRELFENAYIVWRNTHFHELGFYLASLVPHTSGFVRNLRLSPVIYHRIRTIRGKNVSTCWY